MENERIDYEYYCDANVEKETIRAANFLERAFDDKLTQIEYLKVRQIAQEIQQQQSMKPEDTRGNQMNREIIARFVFDSYGVDLSIADDMAGGKWEKTKAYLKRLRREYLDEFLIIYEQNYPSLAYIFGYAKTRFRVAQTRCG